MTPAPFAFFFLAPWTALATLAAAASIPIVIHLLNRKRFRVVPWAAMRFLLAAQKRTVRKLRVEQWLLLAIRTLLIILLILAMVSVLPWAEPVWARLFPGGVGPATAKTGRTHRIIVIDGSFSMGRKHEDGTSFERACAMAKQLVQTASPGDGFSLLLLGSPAQTIVPGPSDNGANVVGEIQQLRLPHGNSDLAGGMAALEKMTAQPLGKYHQREVYILTDLQKTFFQGGSKPGAGDAKPSEAEAWQRLRASVILIDVAGSGADNLAVTRLTLGEPLAMAGALNSATATIHNYGAVNRDQLKVDLLIGRARPGADESKPGADTESFALRVFQQILVNVQAGESVPVAFPLEFTAAGEYVVQVRIESDALELDNVRSLVVRVRESVPVMLVNGKPAAERDDQAAHHLALALNPAPSSRAGLSPFRPKVVTEAQFADVELGDLDRFDCVVLCDVARLSESKVERLETFLRRGGGVVFFLGGQIDLDAYDRLLNKGGEGILPAKLVGRRRAAEGSVFTLTADEDSFQQPPLAEFKDENDRATLLGARFREYIQVQPQGKTPVKRWLSFLPSNAVKAPPGSATQLDPAVLEWQRHRGRVILVTTSANLDWNSWPGSPAYLPFMHELIRHAALGTPPRVVSAGEALLEYLPAKEIGLDALLALPDGRTATVPVQEQDKTAVVRFPDTDQSGIYRMTVGGSRREYLFAVNVPASTPSGQGSESDLRRIEPADLRGADGDVQIVTELSQIRHRARAAQGDDPETAPRSSAGPGVARVLLFLFLALVVLETILAWRFGSARTVVPPDAAAPPKAKSSFWRAFDPRKLAYAPLLLVALVAVILLHEAATDEFAGFLPGPWRQSLERYLGVPEAAPGEGTRWKLDYLPYLTGQGGTDRWLAFGLLLAAAGLAIAVYRAERVAARVRVPGEGSPAARPFWPLAGMRFGLLMLTLVVLLPQLRLFFEREGWPDVVILIDTSKSMSKPDDYQDDKVKSRAEYLARVWQDLAAERIARVRNRIEQLQKEKAGAPSAERLVALDREASEQQELLEELASPNRLNLVKAMIAGKDNDWLTALLRQRQVKVHVYHCSAQTVRLAEVIDAGGAESAVAAVRDVRALGESSQLGGALRAVLNDFRGGSLGAVIMLTDGVTTEGDNLLQAARHAARADVPLFFVGVGDAHEPRDLVLHDLQAEDAVNVRDRLVFDVRLSVRGKLNAQSVHVKLLEKKNDSPIELKDELVTLDPNKPVKVRLTTTPTEPGDKVYVVQADEQPDETDKTNNRVEKAVHVADAKPVKLLYIEGRPRYEYRFLKTLLERERASKRGNRSVSLKTLLVDADRDFPTQDKTALAGFPGREELFAFDAVILGDVDPKSEKVGERNLQLLRDFVREKGGGLLFLAGEDYMPQAYRDTPLADVLPVTVAAPGEGPGANERAILATGLASGYRPILTPVGQQHPIFRLATEDLDNAAIWSALPPLMWAASGYRVKPTGEVLAVHPQLAVRRGGESGEPEPHPLVVQQFVGLGRAMFFGFDETWRWRYREFEPRYNQFWLQTVSYLARSRLGRIEIRLDKQTPYRRNEPIRVTVRFPDDSPAPADNTPIKVLAERARLRRPGGPPGPEPVETQTLLLSKVKGSRAAYEALLTRTPEGEYKFWLATPAAEGPRPTAECRVLPPPGELDMLRMNRSEMEQAAKESRGKFYTLAEAESLIDDLPAGTRVSLNQPRPPWLLWNHAALFALALSLLTSEWILRKRRRLL